MNDAITIRTNNVPRDIVQGYELTPEERKEFDYLSDEELNNGDFQFFRYKGSVYSLDDFCLLTNWHGKSLKGWDGIHTDTFFSGILIKYPMDCPDSSCNCTDYDHIVVGNYYC